MCQSAHLGTGLAQDPHVQFVNQAGILRHWDELGGRNPTALRVAPARQGFEAANAAIGEPDLRLVVDGQLVVRQSVAEVVLQLQALHHARTHGFVEDFAARASLALGRVHGRVCVPHHVARRPVGFAARRDADAHGTENTAVAQPERFPQLH
jgi:hypothetical protein